VGVTVFRGGSKRLMWGLQLILSRNTFYHDKRNRNIKILTRQGVIMCELVCLNECKIYLKENI